MHAGKEKREHTHTHTDIQASDNTYPARLHSLQRVVLVVVVVMRVHCLTS